MTRVFLSYRYDDRDVAGRVRDALALTGIDTTNPDWGSSSSPDWVGSINEAIAATDVVVMLLTSADIGAAQSGTTISVDLSHDLDQRGVDLIPVLVGASEIPVQLRGRAEVDLTKDFNAGIQKLAGQIRAASQVDFTAMTPRSFEHLVADLLQGVGFHLEEMQPQVGADLRATYERTDPFGFSEVEVWLVETKLYSHQRASIQALERLVYWLSSESGRARGLLVTNAQLTSVAAEYVSDVEDRRNVQLRILDGLRLKRLLRQFPAIVEHHFRGDTTGRA